MMIVDKTPVFRKDLSKVMSIPFLKRDQLSGTQYSGSHS